MEGKGGCSCCYTGKCDNGRFYGTISVWNTEVHYAENDQNKCCKHVSRRESQSWFSGLLKRLMAYTHHSFISKARVWHACPLTELHLQHSPLKHA